ADSRDDPAVHELLFNGDFSAAGNLSEVLCGEIRAERLGPDMPKQRMLFRAVGEDHAAETSRIMEPKARAAIEPDVHVIMEAGRRGSGFVVTQSPGHSQVNEQCARFGGEEQVLPPAPEQVDALPREVLGEARLDRPA